MESEHHISRHYDTPPLASEAKMYMRRPADGRDRLLLLAEKTHRIENRHSTSYSPELRPRMGLRSKEKNRSSMFVSEQSLPDKLTQALRNLRPGALAHSASSSAPFKLKNRGAVAADDVVYIASPEPRTNKSNQSDFDKQRKHRSVLLCATPTTSEHLTPVRDPTLKDLDQIRNLYKSVPNVSTLDESEYRNGRYADDFDTDISCSTRSPTDSGYRSTSRHITEENPYILDDEQDLGISHKTTTVVHVNGCDVASPTLGDPVLRVHGANQLTFEDNMKTYGILCESTSCPINERDVVSVLQGRRCKKLGGLIDLAIVQRLTDLMHSALLNILDNIRRLSLNNMKITTSDVSTALKLSYPLQIYSSCTKAGYQSLAMYALSGTGAFKKSLHHRADLRLPVGRIYRFLADRISRKPMSDSVPIYLTAVMECLLEEFVQKIVGDRNTVLSLTAFEDLLHSKNMATFLKQNYEQEEQNSSNYLSFRQMVDRITTLRHRFLMETEGSMSSLRSKKRSLMKLTPSALRCLYYYVGNPDYYANVEAPLTEWTRVVYSFAEHRMSPMVEDCDVQQAARCLLSIDCPPPVHNFWRHDVSHDCSPEEANIHYAFSLISTGNPENVRRATQLLQDRLHGTNPYGLTALSESVLRGDDELALYLLSSGCAVNVVVPKSKADRSPYLLSDYTGWSPLTWAVATQNLTTLDLLISSGAEMQNDTMIKEGPLQVAVQTCNSMITERLLQCGADPFRTSVVYDSAQACFRNSGCPSSLALACSRGDLDNINRFLSSVNMDRQSSVGDFLKNERKAGDLDKSDFQHLPTQVRVALLEAIYYAVELSRPEIALQIRERVNGVPWNIYTWTKALQGAAELRDHTLIDSILADFGPKLATELNTENVEHTLSVLFSLLKWECRREAGNPTTVGFTISRLWHYFSESKSVHSSPEPPMKLTNRSVIDASFVNNQHLSDVRFRVEGELVYGHRIVLFNASDKFKSLLQSPNGVVEITNVSRLQFLAMLEFLYTGRLSNKDIATLFMLFSTADLFLLPQLKQEVCRTLRNLMNKNNVGDIYQFAIVHTNTSSLLEECERFVLEHLGTVVNLLKIRELIATTQGDYDVCGSLSTRLAVAFDMSRTRKI